MNVLVIDDNKLNLAIAEDYLKNIPGISNIVLSCEPGLVIQLLNDNKIDILILDIIMPKITGLDILTDLRTHPEYDDLPIIMLTSLDDKESYLHCFELGAFDYINKPIDVIEFNARLKVAMEWKNSSKHLKSLIEVTNQQNKELKEINAKLSETKFSLVQSEKMAAIGQLAAGIAHEINNPMGFVSSNFDILNKYFKRITEFFDYLNETFEKKQLSKQDDDNELDELNAKYRALKLDLILPELDGVFSDSFVGIRRVTEITQSLRVFARSSSENEKDNYVLLDLIQQVLLITKNELKYVVTVELDVSEDIVVYCDRVQIGQVLVNIIMNAVQAVKSQNRGDKGLIKVWAEKSNQKVTIFFQDDGPGISKGNINKIFEPFFTTKEIGQGTGLGLSISYDIIVNKHNGNISVESEPGKGALFTIILPIISTD